MEYQSQVRAEYSFTDGRIIVRGSLVARGKRKRADYILNYKLNMPYIMGASNIDGGKLLIERWIERPEVISIKYDLIITVKGTVGKVILLKEYDKANLSRQVIALRRIYNQNSNYLCYFIKSYINKLIEKLKELFQVFHEKIF